MPKAASDVMQSIIFAAVVDAMEAMKAASGGRSDSGILVVNFGGSLSRMPSER